MPKVFLCFLTLCIISVVLLYFGSEKITINNDSWLDEDNPLEQQERFTEKTFKLLHGISIAVIQDKPLGEISNLLEKVKAVKKKFTDNTHLKKFIKEIQTPFDLTQTFTNKNSQLVIKNSFEIAKSEKIPLSQILSLNRSNPYTSIFFSENKKVFFFKILTYNKLTFEEQKIFFREIFKIVETDTFFKKKLYYG